MGAQLNTRFELTERRHTVAPTKRCEQNLDADGKASCDDFFTWTLVLFRMNTCRVLDLIYPLALLMFFWHVYVAYLSFTCHHDLPPKLAAYRAQLTRATAPAAAACASRPPAFCSGGLELASHRQVRSGSAGSRSRRPSCRGLLSFVFPVKNLVMRL